MWMHWRREISLVPVRDQTMISWMSSPWPSPCSIYATPSPSYNTSCKSTHHKTIINSLDCRQLSGTALLLELLHPAYHDPLDTAESLLCVWTIHMFVLAAPLQHKFQLHSSPHPRNRSDKLQSNAYHIKWKCNRFYLCTIAKRLITTKVGNPSRELHSISFHLMPFYHQHRPLS